MTDDQKQKRRDYQKEYYKKCYTAKKLNNKIIDDSDKVIDDSDHDNEIIHDTDNENDFYYISIIIKF